MAQPPISTKQLAESLNVTIWLVKKWRREGTGPKWFRIPGTPLVRYEQTDVDDWKANGQEVSAAPEEQTHGK